MIRTIFAYNNYYITFHLAALNLKDINFRHKFILFLNTQTFQVFFLIHKETKYFTVFNKKIKDDSKNGIEYFKSILYA